MRALLVPFVAAVVAGSAAAASAETAAANAIIFDVSGGDSGPVVRLSQDAPGVSSLPKPALLKWVENAARSVSAYYGRLPGPASIVVTQAPKGAVGRGVTLRGTMPTIRIALGPLTTAADLEKDWVLTHEMVHVAFPLMRRHAWLSEGVAVYVEPIARAKAGTASADDVWKWLVWGLPKGLPDGSDRGLDSAKGSWGRTYWGGALFCFLADVEIRRATENRRSLGDALRGILADVGGIASDAEIETVLDAGDRAVGRPVLRPLYERLGKAPGTVELAELFRLLGVSGTGASVTFDDSAPYAAIRRSIATDETPRGARAAAAVLPGRPLRT